MKVFCVGWHKTGTTSVAEFLRRIGFLTVDDAYRVSPQIAGYETYIQKTLRGFDAFADMPFPLMTDRLVRDYPDAHFIHTVRDEDDWMESAIRQFSGTTHPIRERAYEGYADPEGHEDAWRLRYRLHNRHVESLSSQMEHYLKIDIEGENKGEQIADFLGKNVKDGLFPHLNQKSKQAGHALSHRNNDL